MRNNIWEKHVANVCVTNTAHNIFSQICLETFKNGKPTLTWEDPWPNFSHVFFVNGSCVSLELMILCVF